jgi:hypothetical protein
MADLERVSLLSIDAAIPLVCGLMVGLVPDIDWWLRALLVLATSIYAIHTGRRLQRLALRIVFPLAVISILSLGTWRTIANGFRGAFPTVTGEDTLSSVIEFAAVALSLLAGYVFLLRPRGRRGYRVLPAQVIAFGISLIGVGLLTALAGLAWQFQQNWAAGTKPSGAPTFSVVPPQITQREPLPALPAPQQQAPAQPFFSDYNLTEAGVSALADELYKARDALGKRVELDRMSTEGTAGPFISNFSRACDRAGVECPVGNVHPNAPDEKGLLIYIGDINKPPEAAQQLRVILLKLGIDVPFVARPGFAPTGFTLFVGPRP